MNKKPIPFGIPNAFFLYDDYYSKDFPVYVNGLAYPSARQAVISFKTQSIETKRELGNLMLPSDLKDFEMSISTPRYWTKVYILSLYEELTIGKFLQNPEWKKCLIDSKDFYLDDIPFEGQGHYDIEELKNEKNYRGETLMRVRNKLIQQMRYETT